MAYQNPSILTPLQVNVGAGMLNNQGIAINAALTNAISTYNSSNLITPLISTIQTSIDSLLLANATIASLNSLASNTCPALADSFPYTYALAPDGDAQVANVVVGFTGAITNSAAEIIGGGDVSKFCQVLSQSQGHSQQTSVFVNSAINGADYLGSTFTGMDGMITGSVSSVNLATQAFGQDMVNLGQLIDTSNLSNLGSPLALVQQIYKVVGAIPVLSVAFVLAGVPQDIVINLGDPNAGVSDSVQKLMYNAMLAIQGKDLAQILSVLSVKTTGISTMADLLNPVKLFPNSFQSMTVQIGPFNYPIYVDANGTVNTSLKTALPAYVLSSIV
jgi:hypothetical protein